MKKISILTSFFTYTKFKMVVALAQKPIYKNFELRENNKPFYNTEWNIKESKYEEADFDKRSTSQTR